MLTSDNSETSFREKRNSTVHFIIKNDRQENDMLKNYVECMPEQIKHMAFLRSLECFSFMVSYFLSFVRKVSNKQADFTLDFVAYTIYFKLSKYQTAYCCVCGVGRSWVK